MKFSYNWLKTLVNFKESPTELVELLNLRSFEVETILKTEKDYALDAKIPANRIPAKERKFDHHWSTRRKRSKMKCI